MNTLNRLLVAGSSLTMSIGMIEASVDAQGPTGTVACKIDADVLAMYGDNVSLPVVVTDVQEELIERGYTGGGRDGVLGAITCNNIKKFQGDTGLDNDGIVGRQTATALDLVPATTTKPTSDTKYDIDDCRNYDVWSVDTIKQIQRALKIGADGKFGSVSCDAMIKFQEKKGIAQYGKGALGDLTMTALGITNPEKKSTSSASGVFSPAKDCPTSNSCEVFIDLTAQKGYVRVNDWNNNTATGKTLYTYPVQSGKPGMETDTGLFRLGPVEYGPNNNPWRFSTLGSSNGEPNLYKFRRLNPVGGGWSGEGSHASNSFGIGKGSSGCTRTRIEDADVLAGLRSNTSVLIKGMKPVK